MSQHQGPGQSGGWNNDPYRPSSQSGAGQSGQQYGQGQSGQQYGQGQQVQSDQQYGQGQQGQSGQQYGQGQPHGQGRSNPQPYGQPNQPAGHSQWSGLAPDPSPWGQPPGWGGAGQSATALAGRSNLPLILVAGGLGLLLIVGLVLGLAMRDKGPGEATDPISVGTPTATPEAPTSKKPSGSPTPGPEEPANQVVLKNGVKLVVPQGWSAKETEPGSGVHVLQDSKGDHFYVQSFQATDDGPAEVTKYLDNIKKRMSGVKQGPVRTVKGPATLSIGSGALQGTVASSSGSMNVLVDTAMVVKKQDRSAVMVTAVLDTSGDHGDVGKTFAELIGQVVGQMD